MAKDFRLYVTNKDNLSKLVYEVFSQYKPYITKKAKLYERCSNGMSQREDFELDVYEDLYKILSKFDPSKVKNTDNFSFFFFVAYAVKHCYWKMRKLIDVETCILNDEKYENSFESTRQFSETTVDVAVFYNQLTQRQIVIVKDRTQNIHEKETLKKLNISHGTYCSEIIKAQNVFHQYV